jgi:CRISPR-associated protein Cas5t
MLGLTVSVPIACWRKGHAREYLETEPLPPPSTCYGFLLALVGEEDRRRHVGARVTAGIVRAGEVSVVLRTLWRVKDRKAPPGTANNLRPDFQQLATGSELVVWVDRGDETASPCLEDRVRAALSDPASVDRFGGLSLGESTHLVDAVSVIGGTSPTADIFLLATQGRMALPVWVDHVGSAGTRRAVGDLVSMGMPPVDRLPVITPPAA